MRVALCLDDRQGMMFNHRRQSRDRVMIADLVSDVGDGRLFVKPYSKQLFESCNINLVVSDDPLVCAGENDLCFIEDQAIAPQISKISELIIYRWNRLYPADLYFDFDMKGFAMVGVLDFIGSSHEKITKEVWRAL